MTYLESESQPRLIAQIPFNMVYFAFGMSHRLLHYLILGLDLESLKLNELILLVEISIRKLFGKRLLLIFMSLDQCPFYFKYIEPAVSFCMRLINKNLRGFHMLSKSNQKHIKLIKLLSSSLM